MKIIKPLITESELGNENDQFEALILSLVANQYGVLDNFLDQDTITGLRKNIDILYQNNALQAAGLGNKNVYQLNKKIRGDNIKWIDNDSQNLYEKRVTDKLTNFIAYLNNTCYTSIKTFESHYACYEAGSFYKRHIDQFQSDKGRKFSIVLYLNDSWQTEDGGAISLYPKDALALEFLPLAGRIVFFRSDELEHEVKPSNTRDRLSIAAWLKD